MCNSALNSVPQGPQQQKEIRIPIRSIAGFTIVAIAAAVLAVIVAMAVYAQAQIQDKYSLKSPGGIAFSDFRGYEDWAVVSSARTDQILKVIVANPAMITAFKTGVPVNGHTFPDGSMVVKLQWKLKKSTEAPFAVEVPDAGFCNGEGQQQVSQKRRLGIRGL